MLFNCSCVGYWPSYNVPFFETIYNLTGYAAFAEKFGTDFSYQLAPRAKIFRRDQASVNSLATMQHIMRYNGEHVYIKLQYCTRCFDSNHDLDDLQLYQ